MIFIYFFCMISVTQSLKLFNTISLRIWCSFIISSEDVKSNVRACERVHLRGSQQQRHRRCSFVVLSRQYLKEGEGEQKTKKFKVKSPLLKIKMKAIGSWPFSEAKGLPQDDGHHHTTDIRQKRQRNLRLTLNALHCLLYNYRNCCRRPNRWRRNTIGCAAVQSVLLLLLFSDPEWKSDLKGNSLDDPDEWWEHLQRWRSMHRWSACWMECLLFHEIN